MMTRTLRMRAARAAVVALAASGTLAGASSLEAQGAGGGEPKAIVAVLQFDNAAMVQRDEFAAMTIGVQVMLGDALATNGSVRVVEREKIQAILAEQNLATEGRVDPATAAKVGKILGAQFVLMGAIVVNPKMDMRLTVRAINTETSEQVHTDGVAGKGDKIFQLVDELAAKLNSGLKLPGRREAEKSKELGANGPNQFAAMKAMSAARRLEEQGDIAGAVAMYQKSLALNAELGVVRTRLAMLEKKPR